MSAAVCLFPPGPRSIFRATEVRIGRPIRYGRQTNLVRHYLPPVRSGQLNPIPPVLSIVLSHWFKPRRGEAATIGTRHHGHGPQPLPLGQARIGRTKRKAQHRRKATVSSRVRCLKRRSIRCRKATTAFTVGVSPYGLSRLLKGKREEAV